MSYGRCCLSPVFFDDFYDTFLKSNPKIKEKFVNTDLEKQKSLLKHGISYLLMFYEGKHIAKFKVSELKETHSKRGLDISVDMYNDWLKSLYICIKKHDPNISKDLMKAWHEVLSYSIRRMAS
ncbi:MAG: globin [Cytophagales bacterium]|nr:globin [Cytophagales bacterium]